MAKLRYAKFFKGATVALACFALLCGAMFVFSVIAGIEYAFLTRDMCYAQAKIVDIDWEHHMKAPDVQELQITYTVDGVPYTRQLGTDTQVSFEPGRGAHYSPGDTITILYDPQDPTVIAAPQSLLVGGFYGLLGLGGLIFCAWCSGYLFRHRKRFLVSQEEYKKGKADRK